MSKKITDATKILLTMFKFIMECQNESCFHCCRECHSWLFVRKFFDLFSKKKNKTLYCMTVKTFDYTQFYRIWFNCHSCCFFLVEKEWWRWFYSTRVGGISTRAMELTCKCNHAPKTSSLKWKHFLSDSRMRVKENILEAGCGIFPINLGLLSL